MKNTQNRSDGLPQLSAFEQLVIVLTSDTGRVELGLGVYTLMLGLVGLTGRTPPALRFGLTEVPPDDARVIADGLSSMLGLLRQKAVAGKALALALLADPEDAVFVVEGFARDASDGSGFTTEVIVPEDVGGRPTDVSELMQLGLADVPPITYSQN